jgi:NAD/NADP transhydrogenase beta subunit
VSFAVSRGAGFAGIENKLFYAATPSGEITMRVVNPDAAKQFTPGKCYYVDFTEASE